CLITFFLSLLATFRQPLLPALFESEFTALFQTFLQTLLTSDQKTFFTRLIELFCSLSCRHRSRCHLFGDCTGTCAGTWHNLGHRLTQYGFLARFRMYQFTSLTNCWRFPAQYRKFVQGSSPDSGHAVKGMSLNCHQIMASLPLPKWISPASDIRRATARISFCAASTSTIRTGPLASRSSRSSSAARLDMLLKNFSFR